MNARLVQTFPGGAFFFAMTWLSSLPHQIPFRAASSLLTATDGEITGEFLCTVNDEMPAEVMLVEAMAQFAGGLALRSRGYLTAIDGCELTGAVTPGDVVRIEVRREASFGGLHRFVARGTIGGVEIARGRFTLAEADASVKG